MPPRDTPWTGTVEWRVSYARYGAAHGQARIFQRRHAAVAFAERLRDFNGCWAPLVFIRIEERPTGAWSEVVL